MDPLLTRCQVAHSVRMCLEPRWRAIAPLSDPASTGSLPCLLQLRCDQAIVGVASGIAALSERRIVLGLLQLQLGNVPPVLILVSEHPFGLLSRLDRHRRYGAQHLGRDGLIDALAGDA